MVLKLKDNPPIIWSPQFETADDAQPLWPITESLCSFTGPWWVAHTKSRNEKALAHDLVAKNVGYFLPMSFKISSIRGRKIRSLMPLFGGYLFFCGGEKQRLELLKTNRVANIIVVKDQQNLVDELAQIERALRTGVPLTPHNYVKKGQRCRVKAGPLAGLEGIVLRAKRSARLVLQVDLLGQAASVEVDLDLIEPLD